MSSNLTMYGYEKGRMFALCFFFFVFFFLFFFDSVWKIQIYICISVMLAIPNILSLQYKVQRMTKCMFDQ